MEYPGLLYLFDVRSSAFHQLDFREESDLFADQYTACFQGGIPAKSEICSVDLSCHRETCLGVSPGILCNTGEFRFDGDGFCDVTDGQVTCEMDVTVFIAAHTGGNETDLRVFLHIEEVAAFQVTVALFVVGAEAFHFRAEGNGGIAELFVIGGGADGEVGEMSGHVRDHEVLHFELHFAVCRVEIPGNICHGG